MKYVWFVESWYGEVFVYNTEEKAIKELNKRKSLVENCELVAENEGDVVYQYYDKILEQFYFLTMIKYKVN